METFIAACGLICSRCDAFRATKEDSQEKLELVAADWRKRYNCPDIAAENIRCNGCMTEGGPKCGHCEKGCGIRACAISKKLSTCAECGEFPCKQLSDLHGFMGKQGEHLKALLSQIKEIKGIMHSAF